MGNDTKKTIELSPARVMIEFTPDRTLCLKFKFEGSAEELQSVLERGFQYSFSLESRDNLGDDTYYSYGLGLLYLKSYEASLRCV